MLAYKLFINGFKASLSGYNKGLITINDVSYEWDNSEGPTPPTPVEDFRTAEYYANKTTRLNDLITNIDVEGIRPPAFMNYSYSNYPLPEGQTAYLNGRFEQPNHPIEDKGFSVEFTLSENTMITVNVGSPSGSTNANAAIINSNNQFIPAVSFNSAISMIEEGLYSVPSARTYNYTLEINYELEPGTYRLGTPCQTSTQGLRIYGIYKTPEPDPAMISVAAFDYEAEVGTLVKDHLHEVVLVYTNGSSRILDQDEYTTTNALIYEGENILDVWYNENPGILTTIVIEGYNPQPAEPITITGDEYGVSTIPEGTVYKALEFTGTGNSVRSRARSWTDPDDPSITQSWNTSFKNLKANIDATDYNKLILYVSNGSSSSQSVVYLANADESWTESAYTNVGGSRDVKRIEFSLPESGIYSIKTTSGTVDTHEIQLIKE